MMNRLALLALIVCCDAASAQDRVTPCAYDACALRVISGDGYFALPFVVQGQQGYAVANARRSETLENLFAVNDSAAYYYDDFEFEDRIADWSGWVGSALILGGLIADLAGEGGVFSRSFFFYGGGLGVIWGVSFPAERRASTDLATAIWWYNQTLARSP